MPSIGTRLTDLAQSAGVSLRLLDKLAGYPGSGLAQKLKADADRSIDADILAGYAKALGASLDYLVMGNGGPPGPIVLRRAVAEAVARLSRGAGCRHPAKMTTSTGSNNRARSSSARRSAGSHRGAASGRA